MVVIAVVLVRKPVAGNSGGRCRRRVVRGRGLVSALRERGAGPDGRARRQRSVHIHAVRGRAGRRLCIRHGGRPPAATGHDGGRHRSPKLRLVHRHRQLVRPPGGNYAVMTSVRLLLRRYNGERSGRVYCGVGSDACRHRFKSRPRVAFLSRQATV